MASLPNPAFSLEKYQIVIDVDVENTRSPNGFERGSHHEKRIDVSRRQVARVLPLPLPDPVMEPARLAGADADHRPCADRNRVFRARPERPARLCGDPGFAR